MNAKISGMKMVINNRKMSNSAFLFIQQKPQDQKIRVITLKMSLT